MSGHSKWSSIKHKKAATDAKRGQLFTKLAREITMAARNGDASPDMNPSLRLAIQKAKQANMPNDNIDRAMKRAQGGGDADALQEVTYEGYGPGGTAVIVEVVTDNRNRTVADLRMAFSRNGGSLAENGAVAWQFETRGLVTVDTTQADSDDVQLAAIEAGALDVEVSEGLVEVITEPGDLHSVREALEGAGFALDNAEVARVAQNKVHLEEKHAVAALRLFDLLEDLDDVSRVYSNAEFDDEVLEAVAGS
ncbi:MAG: YebC/PmpR family DNA-binding transcriptional regulator [Dehalococcoidia bacterium]